MLKGLAIKTTKVPCCCISRRKLTRWAGTCFNRAWKQIYLHTKQRHFWLCFTKSRRKRFVLVIKCAACHSPAGPPLCRSLMSWLSLCASGFRGLRDLPATSLASKKELRSLSLHLCPVSLYSQRHSTGMLSSPIVTCESHCVPPETQSYPNTEEKLGQMENIYSALSICSNKYLFSINM